MKICIFYSSPKLGDIFLQLPFIKAISKKYKTKVSVCINEHINIKNILMDQDYIDDVIDQTQLENGNAVNFFIGKSWRIDRNNSYLRLNLNINNVLDNTSFKTGGFEQLRYDASNIQRFPNKYGYMYGRTYFIMLSYLF